MLSKTSERKRYVDRPGHQRRYIEWMIDPFSQISSGKELPPGKGSQTGERPSEPGLELKTRDKRHGDTMIPGVIAFGIPLGSMFKNHVVELVSIETGDTLTKQACMSYHDPVLRFMGFRFIWF